MTVTAKSKTPLVVPPAVRRRAGFKSGQGIEFEVSGGMINIIPKLMPADDQYTPEQRRVIDAQLSQALDDVKQGRSFGPFETHREMIEFLHAQVKNAAKAKRRKTA